MKTFHSIFLAVLFLTTFASGQSITVAPRITEADIINATVLVDPFAEKIKEVSPSNFSLRFINNTPTNQVMITLSLEGFVTLEEDRQKVRIAYGVTLPFLVSGQFREYTSKDIDRPGSDISFVIQEVNEEMKTKLKNKLQDPTSGGRAPSGLYEVTIIVRVVSVNGNSVTEPPIAPINLSVNVTNPTTTVLDVPFTNGYVYPTPFPQFQWTYDTRTVKISVFELRPEHQSLEDAVAASNPYLEVMIDRKLSGNLSSFTYPQSSSSRPGVTFVRGPRQLERGRMYVVVLEGLMTAFGFDVAPIRTIRSFSIADPQGQVVINVLQTAFGGGSFQNIYNFIQDQNLQLNASGITLNGVPLSPQDLQKLLIENKDRIISVRFED
jgi:hypothetical protein